ncbi:M20/M25/M40 family metallo-hydrolase [Microbacterium sp.]|uniref:M20/M25/M40 family metallo-hydrolase n=1 Tax=Microbacterium sp. TaxID=51671 RepID=UPI002810CB84|nr:M20/M25/M40 family metallo-hydrolase [Microbacterium sp.]
MTLGGLSRSDRDHDHDHDAIARFLDEHAPQIIERLSEWVRIPSVAADPERQVEVARSANWLAAEMREIGIAASVVKTGDAMAVLGEMRAADPGAPTVLVYSHHDVRHAKAEQWQQTEPFTPIVRGGRLYGRGASDAKGQVMAHLWGVRAHLAAIGADRPAVNVKFLVEGEEEIASPNLAALLDDHAADLACDAIVFSDTLQWRVDAPAPVTSMRGIVNASLTVTGPEQDVHSGLASGATLNPALALAQVLGRLYDSSGRLRIAGFYDDVTPLTEQRRREFDALPYDDADWLERSRTRVIVGEEGYTVKERLWARPSIEVISLIAGDPTGIERSVIPAEASATLSIRMAPGQRLDVVAEQLQAFVATEMPAEAEYELEVQVPQGQEPAGTPEGPLLDALERALAHGHGMPVRGRMGNAGGGPAVLLSERFQAPVLFIGTGLPEDSWHADDESVDLRMLRNGAASIAHLWHEIGKLSAGGS